MVRLILIMSQQYVKHIGNFTGPGSDTRFGMSVQADEIDHEREPGAWRWLLVCSVGVRAWDVHLHHVQDGLSGQDLRCLAVAGATRRA